jgi:hypothetical protein
MSDKQATQEAQRLLGQLLGKQMTYCLSGVARLGVADHMNANSVFGWHFKMNNGTHSGHGCIYSPMSFGFGC